ncbi:DNA repair protein RadC [Xanthomonas sontii]|uniref:JAB domain-containing protein n=1 Tax=Xanthomonas sontii TaxID=2650745 RepID=UPI0011E42DA7|nr:DNA repair protein RadC [Xanthomonas sontii]MDQ7758995.1 DNA repair protein RadC [Xanthomonas sontii]TYD33902.1 DNA repair protein RadC [Xanthomonas sontii]UZK07823.1 DNA repair protein RadC [Xanthomonas sontii]
MPQLATSEVLQPSTTPCPTLTAQETRLVHRALHVLERRMFQREALIPSPRALYDYLRLKLAGERHEVFGVVFLDSQHRAITFDALFQGTINQAAVYPRVIVKRAMDLNACAVILVHNHPSGVSQSSDADRALTERICASLGLIDVRVLDHVIVGSGTPFSFAEAGLL